MDYEKKYKEALERAKEIKSKLLSSHLSTESCKAVSEYIDTIIPELAESEDERIRRMILEYTAIAGNGNDWEVVHAWLEKQKESLHISEISKENADSFTDIKERNIRGCIGMALADVPESRFKIYGVTLKECLAYLEKQKEPTTEELYAEAGTTEKEYIANTMKQVRAFREKQKEQSIPTVKEENYSGMDDVEKAIHRGFLAAQVHNVSRVIIEETAKEVKGILHKEQKPVQTKEEREYVKTLKGLVSDFVRDCGGGITDVTYYQQICDWLDGRHIEQKLSDLPAGFYFIDKNGKKYYSDTLKCGNLKFIANQKEQKSRLIGEDSVEKRARQMYETGQTIEEQKSAERSEEDEHRRTDAIYFLESAKKHYADTSEIEKTIAWLKSLRPQPKIEWSEEDEKIRNAILEYLNPDTGSKYAFTEEVVKWYDWLKSLRPQPHWKPSEEQMEALEYVIRDYREDGCNATANYLQEILDHLKNM